MSRTMPAIVAAVFVLVAANSCIFDAEQKPPDNDKPRPVVYKSLHERDDVIENLETAYNQRNIDQYKRLLDNDFIFHFSQTDVDNQTVNVENWDRAAEIAATQNIFDPNFNPPNGRAPISSIDLAITFRAGEDDWLRVTPSDPVKYPGEVWYEQTVGYFLTVQAGDLTLTSQNTINASFVIRFAEADGDSIWRIIAWRDDV